MKRGYRSGTRIVDILPRSLPRGSAAGSDVAHILGQAGACILAHNRVHCNNNI